jgi:hypothetical protein
MPQETTIHLKNRRDEDVAKQLDVPRLITRPPIQRKNCWSVDDNTEMIDTAVRDWACTPIYIIQRISEKGEEDEVFDGAHKLEAMFSFISNEFALKKVHETSPLFPYIGKKFCELSPQLQVQIKNYKFTLNIIDKDTADDKDLLCLLWKRLNKSGKPLNDHELSLPTLGNFVKTVLEPQLPLFLTSEIFMKNTSKRGEAEKLLQIILAVSENSYVDPTCIPQFTCMKNIVEKWQGKTFGTKMTEINKVIEKNRELWKDKLKLAHSYMKTLKDNNAFIDDNGESILDSAHRSTELVFILGRLVFHFPKAEEFRRISKAFSSHIKEKYFETVLRDEKGRNGGFQRNLLIEINKDVCDFTNYKSPRLFTAEQKKLTLAKQGGMCSYCNEKIFETQLREGDHIIEWSQGGETTLDNCQILHKNCHIIKTGFFNKS